MESFYLKVRKLDIEVGEAMMVMISEDDAVKNNLKSIDKVSLSFDDQKLIADIIINPDITPGEVGVLSDIWKKYKLKDGETIKISYVDCDPAAIEAIRKRMLGKKSSEEDINIIIKEISEGRMSDVLMTYYVASSFLKEPDLDEMYYTAKAMAENGNILRFKTKDNIVADKHCMGGVLGNETTMIVVPIIASLGITIPKSFSKAITTPAATGECVNVLMNIEFNKDEVYKLVQKNNCCLIWGGGKINLAPADDRIIRVSYPLSLEPYSKAVISIMAKKYAMGITHCLIDIPVGTSAKVKTQQSALKLKKQFEYVGQKFGMKMDVEITNASQPIGRGIGPILQVREVLRILEQHPSRSLDLETKSLYLASKLIDLTGYAKGAKALEVATEQLKLGKAHKKMQEIIKAQGGKNPNQLADELPLAKYKYDIFAKKNGTIIDFDMKLLNSIARTLGCPLDIEAGIYLYKQLKEDVDIGDKLFTLYSEDKNRLKDALKVLEKSEAVKIL